MHQIIRIYNYDKLSYNKTTILLSRLKLVGYLSRLMKSLIITFTRHKLFYEDQFLNFNNNKKSDDKKT